MGKSRRGKPIKKIPNWRGTCPICGRTAVKLMWEKGSGKDVVKVCKICGNKPKKRR